MEPKLAVYSNGYDTAVLLDGVLIGKGIQELSLHCEAGKPVMIEVLKIDVSSVPPLEKDPKKIKDCISRISNNWHSRIFPCDESSQVSKECSKLLRGK